jgi:hypothetical protein
MLVCGPSCTRSYHALTRTRDRIDGRSHTDYRCYTCSKSMKRKADLNRHIHSKHDSSVPDYFCPVTSCKRSSKGNGFSRKENLKAHCQRMHPFLGHSDVVTNSTSQESGIADANDVPDSNDQDAVQQYSGCPGDTQGHPQLRRISPPYIPSPEIEESQISASITILHREVRDIKEKIASLQLQILALQQSNSI